MVASPSPSELAVFAPFTVEAGKAVVAGGMAADFPFLLSSPVRSRSPNDDFFAPEASTKPAEPPLKAPKPPLLGALTAVAARGLDAGVVEIFAKADCPNADCPNTGLPSSVVEGAPNAETGGGFVGVVDVPWPKIETVGEPVPAFAAALKNGELLFPLEAPNAPNAPKPSPGLLKAFGVD